MLRNLLNAAMAGLAVLAMPPLAAQAAPEASAAKPVPTTYRDIITLAERVADNQLAMLAANEVHPRNAQDSVDPKGWVQGTYFFALTHLAARSGQPRYRDFLLARGASNNWQLGRRLYHADDHLVGQSYLWAARNGAGG